MTQTIIVYGNEDLKKNGNFKKVNNSMTFAEQDFISYVKSNNLTLSSGYVDLIGFLSNGLRFRCSYNGMVIGVTGIINKINGGMKNEM